MRYRSRIGTIIASSARSGPSILNGQRHQRHIILKTPSAEIGHCGEDRFAQSGRAQTSIFDKQSQQPLFAEEFACVVGGLGNAVGEAEQAVVGAQLYSTLLVTVFGKQAEHDVFVREPR